MQEKGSLLCGLSRDFLEALSHISSRAAAILLIPLALKVQYTKSYNDNVFYIKKSELVELLGLGASYQKEGHINQYINKILCEELFDLEVAGIKIIDIEHTALPRGWLEIAYTQEAMDAFFQGLKVGKYLTIRLDTLTKLKAEGTWSFVKKLLLNYNFRAGGVQSFQRHTKVIKNFLDLSVDDYVVSTTGHFNRSAFEKKRLDPIIRDILTMEQFKLYDDGKGKYLTKTYYYRDMEKFVENYVLRYEVVTERKNRKSNADCVEDIFGFYFEEESEVAV